jgi:hypothetical protein
MACPARAAAFGTFDPERIAQWLIERYRAKLVAWARPGERTSMPDFDHARFGPVIAELLQDRKLSPLDRGRPDPTFGAKLQALDAERLVAPAAIRRRELADACLAALWLYGDDLDRSHRISQGLHGREGSYWHGIMHRREGDFANAKYWFRRVGPHPIHEALAARARGLARDAAKDAAFLRARATWDPYAFVDLCEAVRAGQDGAAELCRKIQQQEWQLLFEYCYRRAIGQP